MDNNKKVYIWETSIPKKWKEIVGKDYFVHISKSNQAKNTLEFLKETHQYINKIRESISKHAMPTSCKSLKTHKTEKETLKKSEKRDVAIDTESEHEIVFHRNKSEPFIQAANLEQNQKVG